MRRRQPLHDVVLRKVRILILVHEDVAKALLIALQHLREALEQLEHLEQQVVKIERVVVAQRLFIAGERVAHLLRRALFAQQARRVERMVLRVGDARGEHARGVDLVVERELAHDAPEQRLLVRIVIDRERALIAEPLDLPPQDARAAGVEREHPHALRRAAGERLHARAHLAGGLVRKRQRQDLPRRGALFGQQVGDAVREHARLAAARTGEHQQRPLRGAHGLQLLRVEPRQIQLALNAIHASIIAHPHGRLTRAPARIARAICRGGGRNVSKSETFPVWLVKPRPMGL